MKANQYAAPLLGLFFLQYATNRFEAMRAEALRVWEAQKGSRNSEELEQTLVRLIGFMVPEAVHYDQTLLLLSGTDNASEAVIKAMEAFETANNVGVPEKSKIVLPKADYRTMCWPGEAK